MHRLPPLLYPPPNVLSQTRAQQGIVYTIAIAGYHQSMAICMTMRISISHGYRVYQVLCVYLYIHVLSRSPGIQVKRDSWVDDVYGWRGV